MRMRILLIITTLILADGAQHPRVSNQRPLLPSLGLPAELWTDHVLPHMADVDEVALWYANAMDNLIVERSQTDPRQYTRIEWAAKYLFAQADKLSSFSLSKLNEVLLRQSTEMQELKRVIFHQTIRLVVRLAEKAREGDVSSLRNYLGFCRVMYGLAMGEETETHKRYKQIFADSLINELTYALKHVETSIGPFLQCSLGIHLLLCDIPFSKRSEISHNPQLQEALIDMAAMLVPLFGNDPLIYIFRISVENGKLRRVITETITTRLDYLYFANLVELCAIIAKNAELHNSDFERVIVRKTKEDIFRELASDERHFILQYDDDTFGRGWMITARLGTALHVFLKHITALRSLGISATFVVPLRVDMLAVENIHFNEQALSALVFGAQSQIKYVAMTNHGYHRLTEENFGKYFGDAAKNNNFTIYASGGHWDDSTIDLSNIGIEHLSRIVVDENVTVQNEGGLVCKIVHNQKVCSRETV